jgi:hypothetical protein
MDIEIIFPFPIVISKIGHGHDGCIFQKGRKEDPLPKFCGCIDGADHSMLGLVRSFFFTTK